MTSLPTADELWLPEIARRGWYLISRVKRLARRPAQVAMLQATDLGAFFFVQKKDYLFWDWVETLIGRWREINSWCDIHTRPFVAAIPERGRITAL